MIHLVIILSSVVFFALYIRDLRKAKLTTKMIVTIALFSGISLILSMIEFIKYPQGGGIQLLSMLPTMLLSILYGKTIGLTGGLIFGLLRLLNGAYVIHPAQFILDYMIASMLLGMAGIFGREKKYNIIMGCLLAVFLSTSVSVISGCIYFPEYAPEGMNVFVYSLVYNFSSLGVEGLLSTIVIAILPLKRFAKELKICNN